MYAKQASPVTRAKVFGKPPSAKKRQQISSEVPLKPCIIVDEVITTGCDRTYGALFSEPISESLDLPINLPIESGLPVKSWQLWRHGLAAILGLFTVSLGIIPIAHAATTDGTLDFSVPSEPLTTNDSASSPSTEAQSSTGSTSAKSAPEVESTSQASQPSEVASANIPSSETAPVPGTTLSPNASPEGSPPPSPESSTSPSPEPSLSPEPTPSSQPSSSASTAPPETHTSSNPPSDIFSFPSSSPPASSPSPAPSSPSTPPSPSPSSTTSPKSSDLGDIFKGGSDSLVARTVGNAEGTRTPDGSKTRAYQGHTDPGNGVWNLGSFSFQHCREYNCSTPEQADAHQLNRLKGQAEKLQQRTAALGFDMTLLEELNGIDLANQAPLAALGEPGYPEWLKKARDMGLSGKDAVLWARIKSYWDPGINGWNAPGLGNSESQIEHDQNRRLTAIARALDVYQQQVAAGKIPGVQKEEKVATKPKEERVADNIIFQDLAN